MFFVHFQHYWIAHNCAADAFLYKRGIDYFFDVLVFLSGSSVWMFWNPYTLVEPHKKIEGSEEGGVCFLVVPVHQWNLSRDDTHITSVRIVQFSRSATLLSIYFQTFSACLDLRRLNLNDPISKKLWNNNRTVHVNERNQNKTKPTNVTFKCTAHSVVWFSPQTMQCIIKG